MIIIIIFDKFDTRRWYYCFNAQTFIIITINNSSIENCLNLYVKKKKNIINEKYKIQLYHISSICQGYKNMNKHEIYINKKVNRFMRNIFPLLLLLLLF